MKKMNPVFKAKEKWSSGPGVSGGDGRQCKGSGGRRVRRGSG